MLLLMSGLVYCNMVWNSAGSVGGYQQELGLHTNFVATKQEPTGVKAGSNSSQKVGS